MVNGRRRRRQISLLVRCIGIKLRSQIRHCFVRFESSPVHTAQHWPAAGLQLSNTRLCRVSSDWKRCADVFGPKSLTVQDQATRDNKLGVTFHNELLQHCYCFTITAGGWLAAALDTWRKNARMEFKRLFWGGAFPAVVVLVAVRPPWQRNDN